MTAAAVALPGDGLAQSSTPYVFTTYGMGEGLSQPAVEDLLLDSTGFLWLGTHGGVNRFSGHGFRAFRHERDDPTSLVNDYVLALAEAPNGMLWVGTEGGGLSLFNPRTGRATHYGLDALGPWSTDVDFEVAGREGRTVRAIVTADDGALVLITDAGPAWFAPGTGRYGPLADSTAADVTALCRLPDGRVAVGGDDGVVSLYPSAEPSALMGRGGIVRLLELQAGIDALRCDPRANLILVATEEGGVWRVDAERRETLYLGSWPPSQADQYQVHDLLELPDGSIWLATSGGVWRLEQGTEVATEVTGEGGGRGIPHPDARRLLLDRRGVLWIATWNGVASLHPLQTTIRRVLAQSPDGSVALGAGVIALETDSRGRVWVGTDGAGVQVLEGDWRSGSPRTWTPPGLEPWRDAVVFDLAADDRGGLWVAAFGDGILRVEADGSVRRTPAIDDSGARITSTVYSVFVDARGDVWAGSYSLGLLRYDRDLDAFRPHLKGRDRADLGSNWIWPIAEDAEGMLWLGAYNSGLASLSTDRTSVRLHQAGPESLSSGRTLCVFVDSEGMVWIGTDAGGLNRFDPRTGGFRVFRTEEGLPHDNVQAVVEDDRGYLWVSTGDGLARFDREADEFLTFTDIAGLAGNRFFANAAHRAPGGELFFGGPAGITIIDPTAIERRESPPRAALTAFRIQGREATLDRALASGGLDLEPDENFFAFEFAAMDFVDATQNRYRYRLEGLDAGWLEAGNNPVANYTSVPPDRYVFRVQARNSEGVWNENALAIPIRVQAPYYQTLWFRSAVLVALLSIAGGLIVYRRRELEARERLRLQAREGLRSEIAGELHDDIGANLSTIVQKAWLVGSTGALDDRGRGHLADMSRLASESVDRVRETVWVVNTKYDTVADLVKKMQDTLDTMLGGQLERSFSKDVADPDLSLTMETRRNVYLMFKECLHNIVKHAQASRVDIGLEATGDRLRLRVRDDGVGFDPEAEREGSGRDLLERRAMLCGGSVRTESTPHQGTTVEIVVGLP